MAVNVQYSFGMRTVEQLTIAVDGAVNPKITFTDFDESGTLNAGSTPPAEKCNFAKIALTAGAATIDMTDLVGPGGAPIDFTGLKVQLIRIKNLGGAAMTFSEGSSNGYELLGNNWSITVPPGGIMQFFLPDTAPDVGSGAKTIDVSGTGTQEFELSLIAG
jgi:hypothetical protein